MKGKKANIVTRHEPNLIVCEVEGKPILELRKNGACAVCGWAELYAPEGVLIRALDSGVSGFLRGGDAMIVSGVQMQNILFKDHQIGIHITRQGIGLGVGPGVMSPLDPSKGGMVFGSGPATHN